ncbi:hypothetical protein SLEP1_g13276 [Rubroshorea leprosula]|uniref:Transposase n=1 Tax=Rubroshorea leprosula TaxID=152421 RepID=A0AAV5IQT9_9ROSI|nr:hypothetical protein SLEP1_g13276 [Rubroshorea leprosula]
MVGEEESGHEERLGEGIDGEVSGGVDEGDLGNLTPEYPIGSKGNTGNTIEKDECSKEPLCSSDRDDEELIDVKKCARSIRRPIEALEVPSGLQTPKGVKYKHVAKKPTPRSTPIKKPTPRSTPIKKLATRSTPVSRGKKVASSGSAELSRLRKEKAKLAEKTDSHYENSDDVGKLRDSSIESKEKDLFFVSSDTTRQRKASNMYFNPSWNVPFFEVGMRFQNAAQFKDAVRKYSVRKSCPLLHIRNEPKRQKFICKSSLCCWEIYNSFVNKDDSFQVKTYYSEHTCVKNSENKMMTTVMVAEYFKSRIYATPFLKCKDMMIFVYKELRVSINYNKCVRAKKMVLKEMEGSFKDEYAMIHAFGAYLKEVNLGNSVFIKTEENDVGEKVFMRMYVCLKVIKDGWKNGCRGIFGVDGCFLKGICKGVLLSAVGRDGNNQMYPITCAVVEYENNDSWTWFMQRLAFDLELGTGHGYTMISDRHPCNLAKRHRKDDIKLTFWITVRASYQIEFLEKMEELRGVSEEAYVEMMDLPRRCKAIISMIKALIEQLMERFREKRLFAETWPNDIAPRVMTKIKETTMREWNLIGIPCPHVLAVVRYINWNYEDFVHEHYKKEKYLQTYGTALECLKGNEVLKRRPERGYLPPVLRTPPGRPRGNRRKDKHKPKKVKVGKLSRLSKHGSVMSCSL